MTERTYVVLTKRKIPTRRAQWRWTFHAANGRKIATSGESYANKADCIHALMLVTGGVLDPSGDMRVGEYLIPIRQAG